MIIKRSSSSSNNSSSSSSSSRRTRRRRRRIYFVAFGSSFEQILGWCLKLAHDLFLPILLNTILTKNRGPGERSRCSDSLRPGPSRDRIPVETRFSAPVHTGPGAHSPYTKGTGAFPGVQRPRHGADHPPASSA
jgi:hypothetical protein